MSMKIKLMADLKVAMQQKNEIVKNTITLVRAAILQIEKDNKVELDDNAIIEVVAKEVKKRRDSLLEYEKSDRQDLIDAIKREIEVLMGYLPEQLSEEEIKEIIKNTILEIGASSPKDMGKVMQEIKPKVSGRADGRLVSELVKSLLN